MHIKHIVVFIFCAFVFPGVKAQSYFGGHVNYQSTLKHGIDMTMVGLNFEKSIFKHAIRFSLDAGIPEKEKLNVHLYGIYNLYPSNPNPPKYASVEGSQTLYRTSFYFDLKYYLFGKSHEEGGVYAFGGVLAMKSRLKTEIDDYPSGYDASHEEGNEYDYDFFVRPGIGYEWDFHFGLVSLETFLNGSFDRLLKAKNSSNYFYTLGLQASIKFPIP